MADISYIVINNFEKRLKGKKLLPGWERRKHFDVIRFFPSLGDQGILVFVLFFFFELTNLNNNSEFESIWHIVIISSQNMKTIKVLKIGMHNIRKKDKHKYLEIWLESKVFVETGIIVKKKSK